MLTAGLVLYSRYERKSKETESRRDHIILDMSVHYRFSPFGLARILLGEKYKACERSQISEMIRDPNIIPDSLLAANVGFCLFNDNQEGMLTDAIRKCIGEEYELRLKQMARDAGLEFYDEGDLRRTGYDKTPDLKLAVPCLYKGRIIHWIESKALFGDLTSHQRYIRDQLTSYTNRFGAGLVIYWFGYLDRILSCPENGQNVFILDRFPNESELELLKFDNILTKV
jgi:CDAN1-interacting nuclease 1